MRSLATRPARDSGEFAIGGDPPVVRLGYGAMQIPGPGVWGEPRDYDEVIRVLRPRTRAGGNVHRHCRFVRPRGQRTPDPRGAPPVPGRPGDCDQGGLTRPGPGRWGLNGKPEHLRTQAERSLRLLGLERIELFQLHRIDPKVPFADQLGALVELQAEGKIGRIGLSEVSVPEIEARPGGPLQRVAEELGAIPAQLALAWLLQRSPVLMPIPGTSTVAHLEENVGAALIELTPDQVQQLDAAI